VQYWDPYNVQTRSFWFTQFDGELELVGPYDIVVDIIGWQFEHNLAQYTLNKTPFM